MCKDLRENNLNNFAPRFGLDLDGTIEKNPRHSTAMLRVFRLRPVQRWPEDWMRNCSSYFLSGPYTFNSAPMPGALGMETMMV